MKKAICVVAGNKQQYDVWCRSCPTLAPLSYYAADVYHIYGTRFELYLTIGTFDRREDAAAIRQTIAVCMGRYDHD